MDLDRLFLGYSASKLRQLSGRIGDCLERLTDEQIWLRGNDEQNAVGNLVLHLCGNVRQWIGFGVANQPDIRVRDREFAARGDITSAQLRDRLQGIVEEAAAIIESVPAGRLGEKISVQKYDLTVLEGIYHVVEHFSQHTGQIIFATKLLTGSGMNFYGHLKSAGEHGQKTP